MTSRFLSWASLRIMMSFIKVVLTRKEIRWGACKLIIEFES